MTTIGYGDITPATLLAKLLATLYLPFAVIALADAVSDVQVRAHVTPCTHDATCPCGAVSEVQARDPG
eukprot:122193-Prymnesium_polylepis.2